MAEWRMLAAKMRALFTRSKLDCELNDELGDHIERETEKNVASGMSAEEARRKALH